MSKASFFSISSNNFILNVTFLLTRSRSAIAQSSFSPPVHLLGLASAALIAIAELDFNKRKVTLSIKLLEEIEKKEALEKYGSEGSGKNLPFSSLSEDLKKKEDEK